MSDEEQYSMGGGGHDEDLTLPRATVQKLINEALPKELTCAKDTRDLIIDCCVEFIHLLSSESNDICEKGNKKTIASEHVIAALKDLGFEDYVPGVEDVLKEHTVQQKDREGKSKRMEDSGLSLEELERQQQLLFAASAARYDPTSH